jgi:biotin transport system substrate-specific component
MHRALTLDGFYRARSAAFTWRKSLSIINKLSFSLAFACFAGILAQMKFYLPWTPVPVVCSTLGAVMAGVVLGKNWGGVSMALYVLLGAAGIPWFSGFGGGMSAVLGPTGGYLIGYVLAALLTGYFTDRSAGSRKFLPMFGIMVFAHLVLIHVPGLIQLKVWLGSGSAGLSHLLWMGSVPFILGDVVKSALGAFITKAVTPKK